MATGLSNPSINVRDLTFLIADPNAYISSICNSILRGFDHEVRSFLTDELRKKDPKDPQIATLLGDARKYAQFVARLNSEIGRAHV